jgi:hypothetical protein
MTQERSIVNPQARGGGYSAHVLASSVAYNLPEFAIPVLVMSAAFDESTPYGNVTVNFAGYVVTHNMGVPFKTYVYWWPMGDDEAAELALVEAELEKIPVGGQGIPAYEKDVVSVTKVETAAPHDITANQSLTLTNISPGPDPALDSNWSFNRSSTPPFEGAWIWNGALPAPTEPEFRADVRVLVYVSVITNSAGLSNFFQVLGALNWNNGTTTRPNVWSIPEE